jgi:serine O-acetyltransferase
MSALDSWDDVATFRKVCALVRQDFRRYRATDRDRGSALGVIFLVQGFWASTTYRISRYLIAKVRLPVLGSLVRAVVVVTRKLVEVLTGISVYPECHIGGGVYFGHFGPTIIHPDAALGENCNLSQCVTVGGVQSGQFKGAPSIGSRVYVAPNAIIIGKVSVGDDVVIGAGAVVVRSVPDRAVVVGNPARVVSHKGSFDFVRYDGMETDDARRASLALASATGAEEAD